MDVDFLPMLGLYKKLKETMLKQKQILKTNYVIPAFESKSYDNSPILSTKLKLLKTLDSSQRQIFCQDMWLHEHMATYYSKWRSAVYPYSVLWQTYYKPYILISRLETPPYDQRFVGFGLNKVSHMMILDALGFNFTVLPDVFIIHKPHSPSHKIIKYCSSPVYRKYLKALKGEFIRDLVCSKHMHYTEK